MPSMQLVKEVDLAAKETTVFAVVRLNAMRALLQALPRAYGKKKKKRIRPHKNKTIKTQKVKAQIWNC